VDEEAAKDKKPRSKKSAEVSEKAEGKRRQEESDGETGGEEETRRQRDRRRAEWEREDRMWKKRMESKLESIGKRLDEKIDGLTVDIGIVAELQQKQINALRVLSVDFGIMSKELRDCFGVEEEEKKDEEMEEDEDEDEDETMRE